MSLELSEIDGDKLNTHLTFICDSSGSMSKSDYNLMMKGVQELLLNL